MDEELLKELKLYIMILKKRKSHENPSIIKIYGIFGDLTAKKTTIYYIHIILHNIHMVYRVFYHLKELENSRLFFIKIFIILLSCINLNS